MTDENTNLENLDENIPKEATLGTTNTMKNDNKDDDEPNPPIWPDSVKMIRPTDTLEEMRAAVEPTQDSYDETCGCFTSDYHFSDRRNAVLFHPGIYKNLDLQVGYYTQVLGLGKSANDVQFEDCAHGPYVPALNQNVDPPFGSSLDSFWRSAENFATAPAKGMLWAVSQAAPLRRVHVQSDLLLYDGGAYASGGHLANAQVDGVTDAGGQQQFLMRHIHLSEGATGGAWSMVHVGNTGQVPAATAGGPTATAVTVVPHVAVRLEKPYLAVDDDSNTERYVLRVPLPLRRDDPAVDTSLLQGPLLTGDYEEVRDLTRVRVVRADEPVSRIQEALDQGKDVVLAAGIFQLQETLTIQTANQVVLGIGLATLVQPPTGGPCIHVLPQVPGVRIGGIMLEAAVALQSDGIPISLFEWGTEHVQDAGNPQQPGGLFDVFCRVGGATTGNRQDLKVQYMMRLHSGHVVADNLWLWRADHAELQPGETANYPQITTLYWQTEQDEYRVTEAGLQVTGNDVTIYGLAVEHANAHQTVWQGEDGLVTFYQCELPYGVSQSTFGDANYLGYRIDDSVQRHALHAPGVYSNFRNEQVLVKTAMEHPGTATTGGSGGGIVMENPFTVRLDNHVGISSIVNGKGEFAAQAGRPMRLEHGQATPVE